MIKILIPLFMAIIGSSCITYDFSVTNQLNLDPKPETCDYRVFTTNPQIPFEEVGIISFGLVFPRTIEGVRDQASHDVCQSGANGLIVWQANSAGRYVKATVIRYAEN